MSVPGVRVLAMCELSQDLLFGKIPPGRHAHYADGALAAGREAASRFSGADIGQLYRDHGVGIRILDASPGTLGLHLRGQAVMSAKGCSVELYEESLCALAEHSGGGGVPRLDRDQAMRIHLAHEFFHILEYSEGSSTAKRLGEIETFGLWFLRRRARILRTDEVAAHSFAMALLDLPCLPNYYDYLYLVSMGKTTPGRLADLFAGMEGLLRQAGPA